MQRKAGGARAKFFAGGIHKLKIDFVWFIPITYGKIGGIESWRKKHANARGKRS
jgi:hypothetical protein